MGLWANKMPLSPYLFIICSKVLSSLLCGWESMGFLKAVNINWSLLLFHTSYFRMTSWSLVKLPWPTWRLWSRSLISIPADRDRWLTIPWHLFSSLIIYLLAWRKILYVCSESSSWTRTTAILVLPYLLPVDRYWAPNISSRKCIKSWKGERVLYFLMWGKKYWSKPHLWLFPHSKWALAFSQKLFLAKRRELWGTSIGNVFQVIGTYF